MNQIGWDIRYALPNQAYLDFVAKWLLEAEDGQRLNHHVDPFAVNVSEEQGDVVYVPRPAIENTLGQVGNLIVAGPNGRGKSTICGILPGLLRGKGGVFLDHGTDRDHPLVVRLFQSRVNSVVSDEQEPRRVRTVLAPWRLARALFNTYWEELFCNDTNFRLFWSELSKHPWWRESLVWYYDVLQPVCFLHPERLELMAWPQHSSFNTSFTRRHSPFEVLKALIRFVTYGARSVRPFTRVVVVVDMDDALGKVLFDQLLCDAQTLFVQHLDNFEIKLFVDDGMRQGVIDTLGVVGRGQVPLVSLPAWDEASLQELLYRRIAFCKPYNPALPIQRYKWGEMISDLYLEYNARKSLADVIVKGAIQGDGAEKKHAMDTPIHTLRLARGVLTACSGYWASDGFKLPLKKDDVSRLITAYWNADQEVPPRLTDGERSRLKDRHAELYREYETLSRKIKALSQDISRALYESDRDPLIERRQHLELERSKIAAELSGIERLLDR